MKGIDNLVAPSGAADGDSGAGRVSTEERRVWDGVSDGWARWLDAFERGGAPVTRRLLALGGVDAGHRVLDVGTGLGEPALSAAALVGPRGHVLGIDVSPKMLRYARRRAAGLPQVRFVEAEPHTVPEPQRFDVVLSRWCLLFLPDPVYTLTRLRRMLVPGGVLAAAVWGPVQTTPMVGLPLPVLWGRLGIPGLPPGPRQPSPYALSQPDECLAALAAAGFADGSVTVETAPFWLDSAESYARFVHATLPVDMRSMLRERFGSDDDPDTWRQVADRAEAYADADGRVRLDSTVLCLRATAGRATAEPPP